ncbi:MAG: hypothetical protein RL131_701 [Bacteroidota bacterium]
MWSSLGKFIIRNRISILFILAVVTAFLGYEASKVQMSYDFSRAIPTNHPKYKAYLEFKNTFGEDGNLLTIGWKTNRFFTPENIHALNQFQEELKQVDGVEDIISINGAVQLVKNDSTQRLEAQKIFPAIIQSQEQADSLAQIFLSLPFYRTLLYNPETKAYLMGLRINRDILSSKAREKTIGSIEKIAESFAEKNKIDLHLSGLPLIRTNVAMRIADEMKWFLLGSLLLSALILFIFFRSFGTMLLSLSVVIIGVVYSIAAIQLLGYKITLLTALIPPLVVVIGIPNCIYFLNKYHTTILKTGNKETALVEMIGKMGVVTLFCNISAALGFAVFALTKSVILKEFGIVAGINIMGLFFISLFVIPIALYYMKVPQKKHLRYLDNKWLLKLLTQIEVWVFSHKKFIYSITAIVIVVSVLGTLRLRMESFIVDDLPKGDKIYTDLKFFESNFRGIMPLEILVDTKRKNGIAGSRALNVYERIGAYSEFLSGFPELARPLSIAEGLKFAKQGFYDGDSNNYAIPNAFDGAFLADYLRPSSSSSDKTAFQKLMGSFIDSNKQVTRISVNMADIGSRRMPALIDSLQIASAAYFDTSKYSISLTGSSITFLEGSRYIINGLKESIIWAFVFIAACMLYLFRSIRILFCSLIPNVIPLLMTAGLMGWAGVALKPSTVLVFSVALGIAIDITIRFLVNYKQELPRQAGRVKETVVQTIRDTGISIVYTSLVLIAGFIIFIFSGFGSTQALGWLTSFTLLAATLTNLILLPALLLLLASHQNVKSKVN